MGSNGVAVNGCSLIFTNADNALYFYSSQNSAPSTSISGAAGSIGLIGLSRSGSSNFTARVNSSDSTITQTSETPDNENIAIFARTPSSPIRYATCRLAFYSIGESLNIALLDNRVTVLMSGIENAIP
jgi:hypothetical protein